MTPGTFGTDSGKIMDLTCWTGFGMDVWRANLQSIFGFLGGLLGGMIGIPGPTTLIYFSMFNWKKDTFIFLINSFNALTSGLLVASFFSQGIYTETIFSYAILQKFRNLNQNLFDKDQDFLIILHQRLLLM